MLRYYFQKEIILKDYLKNISNLTQILRIILAALSEKILKYSWNLYGKFHVFVISDQ